jgi:hypothetical protein
MYFGFLIQKIARAALNSPFQAIASLHLSQDFVSGKAVAVHTEAQTPCVNIDFAWS